MANDFSGFVHLQGAPIGRDRAKQSIGGPKSAALIGDGIPASRKKYESDVSPSRADLCEYGNDYKVAVSQFQQMFDLQPDEVTTNYDLSVLTSFRATRSQQSIDNNPYFYNSPFSSIAAQPVIYTFIIDSCRTSPLSTLGAISRKRSSSLLHCQWTWQFHLDRGLREDPRQLSNLTYSRSPLSSSSPLRQFCSRIVLKRCSKKQKLVSEPAKQNSFDSLTLPF